jgi:ubiquinone/menaquinone biosynthesis C-methylase UbiE
MGGKMLDTLKVWWVIMTQIGRLGTVSRQADLWIRHFLIEALSDQGLFEYLSRPRSYGEIVARFGFVDSRYTREVFATLSSGDVLVQKDGRYQVDPNVSLPDRDELVSVTAEVLHNMTIQRDFAQRIPARMRQEPIDFVHRFEEEGPAIFSFDQSLSLKTYAGLRRAAFAYLGSQGLRGKRLLDVGCGSGHETADIWLRLKGDVDVVAVDPVSGLIDLARRHFDQIVSQTDHQGGMALLTDDSRPTFGVMGANRLDFPDESFDAVFHSLMLHWTPDPAQAIREMARVLKPGGVVFGTQITKPLASPYMNLIITVHEGVHGFFWEEEFRRWYEQAGVAISIATPAGVFKGRKFAS